MPPSRGEEGIALYCLKENLFNSYYVLLDRIDFTSQRKKMTVIMKMRKNDEAFLNLDLEGKEEKIFVLTKGSDDVVINDLSIEKSPDLPLIKKQIKILSS